ncbi:DUF4351 domain-containing protein [Leptolyngbya sp. FACHB-261]|uniref:DUF4351 domain-containing protein n=1 Tax=Leptolyngbya sp. FACHB-261 TaxID=2692806 RepID=UPI001689A486|nr:DUF4351 domain-containing protein [Leptolyngbya sp. FACHB-261]MBD2099482.1 DUF4351 domain-containing protein [Leptolyngbya sp. FACHB-261]
MKPTSQRQSVSAAVQVLAVLRFDKDLIRVVFREDTMRESVIYQDILQQGLQQGVQQGLQQGVQQGKQEEGVALILRLLNRRLGSISSEQQQSIQQLSVAQLEDLAEALLDFSNSADLENWLHEHPMSNA